jgi:hypothetical protein
MRQASRIRALLHDSKACGIHGRWLVQIRAPKILPRLLQIRQFASEDSEAVELINRILPCQRHVSIGVAIEKCEGLHDDRDGGAEPGARFVQQVPLFAGLPMERISRQGKGDPRASVDENRLALPPQTSS